MSLTQLGSRFIVASQHRLLQKLFNSSLWIYMRTLISVMSWRVLLVLGLMLASSVTESLGILMLLPMLQIVGLEVEQGNVGQLASFIHGLFSAVGLEPTVLTVILLYVISVTCRALVGRWRSIAAFSLEQDFVAHIRLSLYEAITKANWLFFTRSRSSSFTHMLTSELIRVGNAIHSLLALLITSVSAAVYFGLALILAPMMTLLVIVCGALLSLLLMKKTRQSRKLGEAISDAYEDLYTAIGEHLAGMKISKSHGIEDHHVTVFDGMIQQVARMHVNVMANYADVSAWFTVGSAAIMGFILYIAIDVLAMPTAGILLLLFLFARLIPLFTSLQQGYQSFSSTIPAFSNLRTLQQQCEAEAEASMNVAKRFTLSKQIRFENVSFSYGAAGASMTLEHLAFSIQAGSTTAVVGPSGAGKSTLADLIVGLVVPQQGQILIDDEPLSPEYLKAWRQQIGYVSQDTFLFHDTIRANLKVAQTEASDEVLMQALYEASAAEFVAALPKGLDTVVGDRGIQLSGGERQRIALARALLRRPALLVLDEATSALDTENEQRIQEAIEKLRGKTTILVIAHRLSTVRHADAIHVLERGYIVESGTWPSLIGQEQGRFRALCQVQGLS